MPRVQLFSFVAFSVLTGGTACTSATTSRPLPEVAVSVGSRELDVHEQVRHALNRLAFGPRPGDVARVTAIGVDRWVAQQLSPARINDSAMAGVRAHYQSEGMDAGALLRAYPRPGALLARQRARGDSGVTSRDSSMRREAAERYRRFVGDIMSARVAQAVASERQLQEVMTDFWLNHFSVFVGKAQLRYYLPEYERETIRPNTLGHFRDLLGAVARSPAMLLYLDNAQSVSDSTRATLTSGANSARRRRAIGSAATGRLERLTGEQRRRLAQLQLQLHPRRPKGINENYARELLELHTLGVDGGYSQDDIVDVARALTGWTVRPARLGEVTFLFNPASHDAEGKTVLGTRLSAGRGIEDGEQVLDLLARHPSTATFIARKLVVRFVSDSPPPRLVERAAATFRRTDGDIREVVRTIVTSPEFFSRSAYRAKVKSPFEVVTSAARALGGRPDSSAISALLIARLGQPIYGHQAPNGWPETGDAWMNTGAILSRINFGLSAAANRLPGARVSAWPEYATLNTASRETQVDGVIQALLGGEASPQTRAILSSGVNPMLTSPGDSRPAPSDDMMLERLSRTEVDSTDDNGRFGEGMRNRPRSRNAPPSPTGLAQIIGLALGSPEFQRR